MGFPMRLYVGLGWGGGAGTWPSGAGYEAGANTHYLAGGCDFALCAEGWNEFRIPAWFGRKGKGGLEHVPDHVPWGRGSENLRHRRELWPRCDPLGARPRDQLRDDNLSREWERRLVRHRNLETYGRDNYFGGRNIHRPRHSMPESVWTHSYGNSTVSRTFRIRSIRSPGTVSGCPNDGCRGTEG